MSLSVTINLLLKALQKETDEFGQPTDNPTFPFPSTTTLANGTASGQANIMHHRRLTLVGTTPQTLDLHDATGAGLKDEFGNPLTFDKMKVLAVYNRATNAADIVTVGAAAANAWNGWTSVPGSTFNVGPGGLELKFNPSEAGFAVTAGTGDQLKFVNASANTVSVDVFFVGVDA